MALNLLILHLGLTDSSSLTILGEMRLKIVWKSEKILQKYINLRLLFKYFSNYLHRPLHPHSDSLVCEASSHD